MVGFPGEGEEQFANTQAVVQELPLAYLHVFSFSDRPGTAAVRMNNHVPGHTIKARSRKLAELSRMKRLAYYQRFVGRTVEVLFESKNNHGIWTGLTDNYVRVGVPSSQQLSNRLQAVVISGITDGLAVGHLIEPSPLAMMPSLSGKDTNTL